MSFIILEVQSAGGHLTRLAVPPHLSNSYQTSLAALRYPVVDVYESDVEPAWDDAERRRVTDLTTEAYLYIRNRS